jgi:RNA polymerase sigma-70 factor (ECF subfamily)
MHDPGTKPTPPTEAGSAGAEDFQLVRRFREVGDAQSFRLLVERHQPSVRRLLWVMLRGAREEIEDVEQEVLLSLYRGLANFRFQSSFRTYLLSVTRHRALDALRRQRRRQREERALRLLAPSAADAGEQVQDRERAERVLHALRSATALAGFRRLPIGERQLVLLRDIEGLSMEELAATLELPVGTVKSRLHRARARLARILGERI